MRNYPLLKKSGIIPTEENWQHTYVDFLAFQSKSLVDYSNYFLTDYRRGPDFIRITEEGEPVTITDSGVEYDHCYSIENLKFHQFRDTETEVAVYFLKVSDYYEYCQTHSKNYKIIRSGRHIINNNQMADHMDIDMIWDNIIIQPIGYSGLYVMNFYNGQFIFDYTKNAEYYMTNQPTISVLDFYTRFFWKEGEKVLDSQERSWTSFDLTNYVNISDDPQEYEWSPFIIDKQGILWTDVTYTPVMAFIYQKSNNDSYGEEMIADVTVTHYLTARAGQGLSVCNISTYGIAGDNIIYWPENTAFRLL